MSLIKKLTSKFKEEKNKNYFDFFLNEQNAELKKLVSGLSTLRRRDQKTLREEKVRQILKELNQIEHLYKNFIRDVKKFENLKTSTSKINNSELEEKLSFMLEKKKSLRRDFESIYINFKKTAMGLEDVPMKMILKRMRETFDFDNNHKEIQNSTKYYDSTTMTIRYI